MKITLPAVFAIEGAVVENLDACIYVDEAEDKSMDLALATKYGTIYLPARRFQDLVNYVMEDYMVFCDGNRGEDGNE